MINLNAMIVRAFDVDGTLLGEHRSHVLKASPFLMTIMTMTMTKMTMTVTMTMTTRIDEDGEGEDPPRFRYVL